MQSQACLGYAERKQILQSEYNYLRNLNFGEFCDVRQGTDRALWTLLQITMYNTMALHHPRTR